MKRLTLVAGLALMGSALVVVPTLQATAVSPKQATPSIVSQMKSQATGTAKVKEEKATGKVGFIRTGAGKDLMPGRSAQGATESAAKADAYLAEYASAFGAAAGELHRTAVVKNDLGFTVSYQQRYQGVPVFGSKILANLDRDGHLRAVNGFAAPGLDLSTTPRLSAAEAAKAALAQVRKSPPTSEGGAKADLSGLETSAELVVYRTGFTRGVDGHNVLAYAVEVTNGKNIGEMVIVRADSTKVLNRYTTVASGLERYLYTWEGDEETGGAVLVWQEGQNPLPTDPDMRSLVRSAGESYWLFENAFDRDSYDGAGGPMITLHNRPDSCPNASWNGAYTSYCDGVYSDDIVAHEWGHAYTQYTSNLIYQWQSGALNESYSDVWGETLDLINNREDEEEGDLDTVRPADQCSVHMRAPIEAEIIAPASIAGPCAGAAAAAFGPQFTLTPTVADVVVATDPANDGDTGNGTTLDGCSAFDAPQATEGTWAYVDRGQCAFVQKVQNAFDAGYEGIVVGNNQPTAPFAMAGNFDSMYGVMVNQADGAKIKSVGTATISVVEAPTGDRTESYRWLIGEDSPGFGGATRDMWNPVCGGNAGKVSDIEYVCGFDDQGGVHSNSGVPNHAYALAVDGGTYNGQTITGMGLDRAAAIWWRTGAQYLTPASDFPDMAEGLMAACEDLVGTQPRQLTVKPDAKAKLAPAITADNCANLALVITATEMTNNAIEMCDYQPLLDGDTPSVCGAGFTTSTVWSEDFEDQLAGWGTEQEIVFPGGFGDPWVATSAAPGDHPGGVAYAPMVDGGSCSEGDGPDDASSRDSIISPAVTMPATGQNPLLSFDHYVATELGYDAVSLAYRRNGGAFTAVPVAAYVFNAPTEDQLPADPGNGASTNPLVGEPAWTGTDEGQNKGTWGQTQVSLSALGAVAGDSLEFRFDAGRDGCGGADGWYVDNVTVTVCLSGTTPTGTPTTGTPTTTPTTTPTATPTTTPPAGKAATTVKVRKPKEAPEFKDDFRLRVKVVADDLTPTGRVVVKYKGVKVGSGRLVDGKVKVTVKKNLAVGKHKLVVKYKGSTSAKASKKVTTIKVVEG